MATVTGLTAEKMLEIEAASIIDGNVVGGELILIKHDGTEINAGPVTGPSGPPGPAGPPGLSAIPGEVKLWSGDTLPDPATYGKWVWADGAYYPVATYPLAAAHIADEWRTFDGASDPGASNFRVPDLRGLVAAGMDAMPGGSRPSPPRMSRAVAIILAARTGKETHVITIPEMPSHGHPSDYFPNAQPTGLGGNTSAPPGGSGVGHLSVVGPAGGGQSHENVQPTVFVPYIVKLDG